MPAPRMPRVILQYIGILGQADHTVLREVLKHDTVTYVTMIEKYDLLLSVVQEHLIPSTAVTTTPKLHLLLATSYPGSLKTHRQ